MCVFKLDINSTAKLCVFLLIKSQKYALLIKSNLNLVDLNGSVDLSREVEGRYCSNVTAQHEDHHRNHEHVTIIKADADDMGDTNLSGEEQDRVEEEMNSRAGRREERAPPPSVVF